MNTGFYAPSSYKSSYVKNINEVGIQKQAALQELGATYDSTINNAYASYLANQRSIDTSAMGEGYKEAYRDAAATQLQANIAETNLNAASTRQNILSSAAKQEAAIGESYNTQLSNIDRTMESFNQYYDFVKSLSNEQGGTYFDEFDSSKSAMDLGDKLLSAQPTSYSTTDDKGVTTTGKSFSEWLSGNLDYTKDRDYADWLFNQGGYQAFAETIKGQSSIKGADSITLKNDKSNILSPFTTIIELPDSTESYKAVGAKLGISADTLKNAVDWQKISVNNQKYVIRKKDNKLKIQKVGK